jgi:predicted O-methyltransferase YrrM
VLWGRRLGWYAFARILKPGIIIETGVDKGHGAIALCAALLRNGKEGYHGRYYGTDINPASGYLLSGKFKEPGTILYGDSIESLKKLDVSIDLFINDSDHSKVYEYNEYCVIKGTLSPRAIILGDNSHSSDSLARFSAENGRKFLFFQEGPKNHWYPGAGIGISFT